MWLDLALAGGLGLLLLSRGLCYFELLERLFAFASRQLKASKQQQAREDRNQLRSTTRRISNEGEQLRPPAKDKLNMRMEQCCDMIAAGLRLVLEDEVTPRFVAATPPLEEWNLLTRNLSLGSGGWQRRRLGWRLRLLWLGGLLLRYTILLPIRAAACSSTLVLITLCTGLLGQLPGGPFQRLLAKLVLRGCFRLLARSFSIVRRVHNLEHRPCTGICVANHTSPLDSLVLMCDVNYSLTGQRHDGLLGVVQRALTRASSHMWFERRSELEREALAIILRLHVAHPGTPPVLIFPEGTCINNTAVLQFKKGSFAVSNIVYPVAVRYDRRFGEAFWDSSRFSMLRYILSVISSWSILCDVWYMPALKRYPSETPIEFASRVKSQIAAQAGLVDLPWDGNLKRWNPVRDW